ncbi:hypothetical protein [Pseudomonas sichuanensis]|uniref:hypothetical protein n=1 Tax=Pseudomonas sichuanensis TaxID=2213015 RepID=UPI002ACB0D38|nr:hypothetical protein [Pseudomonas sichuanensis]
MTVQIPIKTLAAVSIPEIVERAADSLEVRTFKQGISDLPAPFNTATLWVACREAWPHNDPDFEGLIFISVVIRGSHRYGQLGENNVVEYVDVKPGSIFPTNPLALHWLEPKDPDLGFIALQWEVPFYEYERYLHDLAGSISPGAIARQIEVHIEQGLVVVNPLDYSVPPPGYPSLISSKHT